jgi:hypothetical protein
VRRKRVKGIEDVSDVVPECCFGSNQMIDRIEAESQWDVFCHHAAYTEGYKRDDFDYVHATLNNTNGLRRSFQALAKKGCRGILATGTVFEADEGMGKTPLRAFSPYGLSKTLSWQIIRFEAWSHAMGSSKFVIPNPFGLLEDFRFTSYLAKTWLNDECPCVCTPAYLSDNIPVTLLGSTYVSAVEQMEHNKFLNYRPSYYIDIYQAVKEQFAPYSAKVIKGRVPESLDQVDTDKVCYLSLDMNITMPEIAAAEHFWDKMAHGGVIILDDYGWAWHTPKKKAFDKFAAERSVEVMFLPTGQGLIFKS